MVLSSGQAKILIHKQSRQLDCSPEAHNDFALIGWEASGEPTLSRDFHMDMAYGTGVPAPSHLH